MHSHEFGFVEAVARAFHTTPLDPLTTLILLKDWVSQQIDLELDAKNAEGNDE